MAVLREAKSIFPEVRGKYEGHLESKESFAIKKIFIDNRKEKEYAGFITHLHLLLHIVTLDIEALVVP